MGCSQSTEAAGNNGKSKQQQPTPEAHPRGTIKANGTHSNAANGTVTNSVANSAEERSVEPAAASPTGDALNVSQHSIESLKSLGSAKSGGSAISSGGRRTDMSDGGSVSSGGGGMGHSRKSSRALGGLGHSSSIIGLDSMIENRREEGGLTSNVVHMEVPFGKPIEEVYDGIYSGPVLGSGISGLVRLVTHKATGVKYAVKCLDLSLVDTASGLQQLREEIFIMCQLDHPNIVRLEEVYESHSEIYLVQELCLGGELFDRLDEQPDYRYTEAECARLVKQMLCAVRYLHSKGIIHRDLKLENFLFSSTAKDSELKMIDFGLSKHFRYGEIQHEAVGTPYTVAPEVIRGNYDEKCDIWAIGVIAFLLLSGDPPFGGCGGPEPLLTVRSNILSGKFYFEPEDVWSLVSERAREFIRALLVLDTKKRPTAQKAQTHPWLVEWVNKSRTEDDNVLNPNVIKALVTFKEFSDMRKLLCEVLSFTLLPDQIKDLRKEFEKMDTDGSGEISLSALKQVLVTTAGGGSLGALTEEEVEDIFNAMRVNKTETRIHWHEFIAAGLSQCQVDDRNLRLAFDRLDSDHKGYVTLDDVMDLVGSDSLHSEEVMIKMWGDSIKAVNCTTPRITYDDFLLLMKGQTRDDELALDGSQGLASPSEGLVTVPEDGEGDVTMDALPRPMSLTPIKSPGTDDFDLDTPLSMDDDDDIPLAQFPNSAGLAITNSQGSLTPPTTPRRGPTDFVSPVDVRRKLSMSGMTPSPGLEIPGFLTVKPAPLQIRSRSRSVGDDGFEDQEAVGSESPSAPKSIPHASTPDGQGAIALPENEPDPKLSDVVDDKSGSVSHVNIQLYRAHRQMRLSVAEASKRFEEQQTRHARDLLQREADGEEIVGMRSAPAGLVMRRGIIQPVTSEVIKKFLQKNETEQQVLVEKANKSSGRGRRLRTKTVSDMTAMVGSLSQDQLHSISIAAAADSPEKPLEPVQSGESAEEDDSVLRGATIPGAFRHVKDPFGAHGKYASQT